MNEEILKLAKDCGFSDFGTEGWYDQRLEAFYKAAYNEAIKDVVLTWNGGITLDDIRALEMK